MKVKLKVEREYDVKYINVDAYIGGRDSDESMPCTDGDRWSPVINIDTGVIMNWEQGVVADICYKVRDRCCYSLEDYQGNVIVEMFDEYVPDILCPEGDGYGDYIIMKIDINGVIAKWNNDISDIVNISEGRRDD
jgi:hypothetical protein